ncbi:MAG TPA: hypothetical protein PLZ93_03540 [Nocardioides sp.]|uniref:hypothetical protein n=1 Tax=uncultured Nocardioides sp. TaxID=198441 RepID=UPI002627B5F9|nr:hypothetical protein [uncultured Nocardioides sp.]HRD59752.1 hypothetical protein [Nocardioides sp.]HRI94665.1 hypothetical protein [Nocardioides sp.]HRK44332.1 hypothetical protein [Nocardioides sp.]
MQKRAFAVLLPPDRVEASAQALASCWLGERREAFQDARRRAGIVREAVWIQSAPGGSLAILYLEADDVDIAFTLLKTSAEPFDIWFREQSHDVHGIALAEGFSAPELVLDFDIGTI